MRIALALALALASAGAASAAEGRWRPAWYAAPFPAIPSLRPDDRRVFRGQTVRQTMMVEASGRRLRLRLTNELGRDAVRVATVRVGHVAADGSVRASTTVRFAGRGAVTIPAGAPMVSDPVPLKVRRLDRVAVSVHYAAAATPAAHLQPVMLANGNQTGAARLRGAEAARAPGIVAAVEIDTAAPVIVAIGDSITEATPEQSAAHRSWPQRLGDRVPDAIVVNAGVSGSRLLRDGAGASLLARLDRDALTLPGVTHVVLLIGINDIGNGERTGAPVTAREIIAAYAQVIARAHAHGIKVVGGTILPYRGAAYFTERGEAVRRAVNAWVQAGDAFDATVDFAAIVADPADPSRLAPAFDPGDHLHPNDAGYAAMARAAAPVIVAAR